MSAAPESVYVEYTHGCCWRRVLDARKLHDYLRTNGYQIAERPKQVGAAFLITCSFIKN